MDVVEKLVEIVERASVRTLPKNTCHTNIVMLVNALIEEGVTVQEWISVKDRFPDWRDGKVLVFTKYGFSICERTVNNRWQGQHANWITHWSYLPQPPKGD